MKIMLARKAAAAHYLAEWHLGHGNFGRHEYWLKRRGEHLDKIKELWW